MTLGVSWLTSGSGDVTDCREVARRSSAPAAGGHPTADGSWPGHSIVLSQISEIFPGQPEEETPEEETPEGGRRASPFTSEEGGGCVDGGGVGESVGAASVTSLEAQVFVLLSLGGD